MDLHVTSQALAEMDARVAAAPAQAASASVRAAALVELAWHLRQRDSCRALSLASQAERLLAEQAAAFPLLQLRIELLRCEVAALFSQLEQAEAQLARARALLGPTPAPILAGDALLAEALVAKARGQRERELDAYGRAASIYAGDPLREATARAWLAYERAFGAPAAAESLPAQHADPAVDALCCAARGLALSRRDPARAAELFLHASEQAQRAGLLRHAIVCTMNAGSALQGLADYDQAAACYDAAAGAAHRTGWPALIGSSETRLGAFLKELGRLEESCTVLREALDMLAVTPAGINKANAAAALAQTLLALGRGVEAVGPMSEAIRMYREARSTDNLATNLLGHARALSAAGEPEAALAALDEVRELIARHDFSALLVGVYEALAEIHQRHAAVLPAPVPMREPNACLHYAEATLREGQRIAAWKPPASLYIYLAEGWAAAGDTARAYDYARKALAVKDQETALSLRHPLAVLRLRTRAENPPAAPLPLASFESFEPLRVPTPPPAPQPPALTARLLTPKEREIMQLLARSYSNKEIATALEMGEETVKWHLKKMYGKLQAGSRKHAVTRARTLGVISFSS